VQKVVVVDSAEGERNGGGSMQTFGGDDSLILVEVNLSMMGELKEKDSFWWDRHCIDLQLISEFGLSYLNDVVGSQVVRMMDEKYIECK
jgi:hypothetical protein